MTYHEADPNSKSELYARCACGWKRWLVNDPMLRLVEYIHLDYGKVSHVEAARRDAKNHDCNAYREAVSNLKRINYRVRAEQHAA